VEQAHIMQHIGHIAAVQKQQCPALSRFLDEPCKRVEKDGFFTSENGDLCFKVFMVNSALEKCFAGLSLG